MLSAEHCGGFDVDADTRGDPVRRNRLELCPCRCGAGNLLQPLLSSERQGLHRIEATQYCERSRGRTARALRPFAANEGLVAFQRRYPQLGVSGTNDAMRNSIMIPTRNPTTNQINLSFFYFTGDVKLEVAPKPP